MCNSVGIILSVRKDSFFILLNKVPDWLVANRDVLSSEIILVNTAKGLYLREKCLLSEAVFRALGQGRANQPYVVLSGPSFAIEIIKNHPTADMACSILSQYEVFMYVCMYV